MRSKLIHLLVLALGALLAIAPAATAEVGFTKTLGSAKPIPGARTVPYFSHSFSSGGVTYPYTMVGTNPATSQATTTVPTVIVPLRFVFADGSISDPGTTAADVIASPLFQSASFASGTTQYGDAIRRAMFWQYLSGNNYHVKLGQPVVLPTQTIDVPKGHGLYLKAGDPIGPPAFGFHTAAATGVVSESWFYTRYDQLLNALKVDPKSLPMLLSRNVLLSSKPVPYGTPVLGFHSVLNVASSTGGPPSGNQQVQTALWASYEDPYIVAEVPSVGQNTDILSHEIAEWLHDPFISNSVPAWQSPFPLASFFYGCSSLLETGDPLADVGFEVNGYQLQDEAFLSWFAHQLPSIGINGQYSYLGTFSEPSPSC